MATAPNGDLIVAVDERIPSCGDLKWNPDINIVMRRSSDHGQTWSGVERVIDYPPGKSASDPSFIVDGITKTIFLFFNYMDLDNGKDIYHLMVSRSVDNGQSWSDPADITPQITKPEWHNDFMFITSGHGIQTRGGKLIHTLVNLQHGLHLFASVDHGESWHLIDVPIRPADESKIVELMDGRWMVNSRVNDSGLRYVHISADEGKTWTSHPDSMLTDPGCNASLVRYEAIDGGLLLFSNANDLSERKNMTIKVSDDEGHTWFQGKTVYAGSSAYSTMTILENGEIGLLFEKDDYREIVFVRLALDWLTEE
jgi:sialidase-1